MIILGIETSCDDTAIAIIEGKGKSWPHFRILSNIVASQIEIHKKYGGVYPNLAKREHIKNLPITLAAALKKAKLTKKNPAIDVIAITYGPGLSPCLWTGINFAKELAQKWHVPLVPVDHMEGHLLVGLFTGLPKPSLGKVFPAIVLLVSGGHTQLILMKNIGKYELLGETRDDAAGEAFDKTARILGLPYPGGPAIEKIAAMPKLGLGINLPRPMIHSKDFDFSFSGLKTAVLYDYQKRTKKVQKSKKYVRQMAKEIQQAIIDVLIKKTMRAQEQYKAKSVILGGGVCANQELRSQLKYMLKKEKVPIFLPLKSLATDNGIMPALAGYFTFIKPRGNASRLRRSSAYIARASKAVYSRPKNSESIIADPNLQLG
ncbi:tRNA (adenosine(37)-N6)-threonylcarbamoyltransferase complex transferase subunit TsaD [Patescibacteria group bacterium]|nr:tRNA (adenosine(37)-N6)-threonylcarbamoyltransferase complex transferase subunit TsaD [Patescibacteria group bacterium]